MAKRTTVHVVHCTQAALITSLERMGEMWGDFTQVGGMPNTYEGYVEDLVTMFGIPSRLTRAFGVREILGRPHTGRYPQND